MNTQLALGSKVIYGPGLLPRVISWSQALTHLGVPVLVFVTPVTTKGHIETYSLSNTLSHVSIWESGCHWSQTELGKLCCHLGSGVIQTQNVSEDHVWFMALLQPGSVLISMTPVTIEGPIRWPESRLLLGPCWSGWPAMPIKATMTSWPWAAAKDNVWVRVATTAWVCADICCLYCKQRPHGFPRSGPVVMLVSESWAAAVFIQTWVTCAATRTIAGFMVQQQRGSMLIPMAQEPRAKWTSESWATI